MSDELRFGGTAVPLVSGAALEARRWELSFRVPIGDEGFGVQMLLIVTGSDRRRYRAELRGLQLTARGVGGSPQQAIDGLRAVLLLHGLVADGRPPQAPPARPRTEEDEAGDQVTLP